MGSWISVFIWVHLVSRGLLQLFRIYVEQQKRIIQASEIDIHNRETDNESQKLDSLKKATIPTLISIVCFILFLVFSLTVFSIVISNQDVFSFQFLWIRDSRSSDPYYILPLLYCWFGFLMPAFFPKVHMAMGGDNNIHNNHILTLAIVVVTFTFLRSQPAYISIYFLLNWLVNFIYNLLSKMLDNYWKNSVV
jgi:membrane protein insertase Oxa1/YidC/SpoIIIJ